VAGPFFGGLRPNHRPPTKLLIILHSLASTVEQLCARSPDAPTLEKLRPLFCVFCGQTTRNAAGILQLVGHGVYCRQVCGLAETGWIEIWVRRFLCLACGHTMSLLPDWLHPGRWYAGTVIIEALYRHCILYESAHSIGARFGRFPDATEWRSLRRWRKQLLISPTLWGWLGIRLGITKPASNRKEGRKYLQRLLAEGGQTRQTEIQAVEVSGIVRRILRNLIFHRKTGWSLRSFLPEFLSSTLSNRLRPTLPTEKDSGPRPP
jgi:hypothetical protein